MPSRELRVRALANLQKAEEMLAFYEHGVPSAETIAYRRKVDAALSPGAAAATDTPAGKITARVSARVFGHSVRAARALVHSVSESLISAFIDDTRFALTCGRKKRGMRLLRLPNPDDPSCFIVVRAWPGNASPAAEKKGPPGGHYMTTFDTSTLQLTVKVNDFGIIHIDMPRTDDGDLDIDGDVSATATPLSRRT